MANADREVKVIVGGDSAGGERALKNTHSGLEQLDNGFRNAQGAVSAFRSAIAGLSLTMITRELLDAGMAAERFRNSFAAATGSMAMGQVDFAFARSEANRLGIDIQTTADSFLKLSAAAKGTALEGEPVRKIFSAVAESSRALGLSSEESKGALLAISQMMSKGTVQAEELRGQLGERMPGAFQIAARAMGVSTAELGKMLEQGKVLSDDFLPKFAAQLQKEFPASAESVSGLTAEVGRLKTSFFELKTTVMESGGDTVFSYITHQVTGLNEQLTNNIKLMGNWDSTWEMMKKKLSIWGGASVAALGHASIGEYGSIPGDFASAIGAGKNMTQQQLEALGAGRDPFSYSQEEVEKLRKQFMEREKQKASARPPGKPDKVLMELQKDQIAAFLKYAPFEAETYALGYGFNKYVSQNASPLAGPGILGSGNMFKNMTGLDGPKFSLGDFSLRTGEDPDLAKAREDELNQSIEFSMRRIQLEKEYGQSSSDVAYGILEARMSALGQEEEALNLHYQNKQTQLADEYTMKLGYARQIGMDTTIITEQYNLQQIQIEQDKAQRLADIWWNNSQTYVNFAQQMSTMGLQYLFFEEQQRDQIGKRMLASSVRFIAQGLQQYMMGKAKEHVLNAAAAAGKTTMDMTAATANLGILEAQATAWAAFFMAMSLNPYGGQAFVPAATAMTAVAGGAVPAAMAAVAATGASSVAAEWGMAALWGAGGVLAGALGEAGASAIEGGTSGGTTPAGYGGGSPASPVVTQPTPAQSSGPQVTIVLNNPIGEKKWFEDNLPAILKDMNSRNVDIGYAQ